MLAAIPTPLTVLLWAAVVFAILVVFRAIWDTVTAVKGLVRAAGQASTRLRDATAVLQEEQARVSTRMDQRRPDVSSEQS